MPKIIRLKEIDSTNKYAIEKFDSLDDRTLVSADSQTAGRGRRQKNWFSPPGANLYASFLIKEPKFNVAISSWIGGLAALSAVRELVPNNNEFWIKWPNDVYCRERKLAGVLCETVSDVNNNIRGVVIGIGINVNMKKEQLDSIDRPATSILAETDNLFDLSAAAQILLEKMNFFTDIAQKSEEELYMLWKADNKIIGRNINVDIVGKETLSGKAIDIKKCGSLYVIDSNGEFRTLYSGDVSVKL